MVRMVRHAKSGFFLLEMIISITIFALCSAVCMSLFVQARMISTRTKEVNMALLAAQSAAEGFKAANGAPGDAAEILGCDLIDGGLYINYDENWQKTQVLSSYRVNVYFDAAASPARAEIDVMNVNEGELLHSIVVEKYSPNNK